MTRRELREHCFKLLFCADFYSEGETREQIEQYFTEPREDDYTPEGVDELIHCPELDVYDSGYVKTKVEKVRRSVRSWMLLLTRLPRAGAPAVWERWRLRFCAWRCLDPL